MKVPDIYFEEFWGRLNAEQDGGVYESYTYEDENGLVLHRFIKRPTNLPGVYDLLSPTGFSGPIILRCKENMKPALVRAYDLDFQQYCAAGNIVAEYVRFSPWLKNHEDFKEIYELKHRAVTFGIDLTKDYMMEEFGNERRGNIRKAELRGVEISYDFTGDTIEDFLRIYTIMYEKNNKDDPTDEHMLDRQYIEALFSYCKDHFFIIHASAENTVISTGLFVFSDQYLHGYLGGNDPHFNKYNANSLIIARACDWGSANGKIALHLGSARNEGIHNFKKQFTKDGLFDFYIGHKIRLNGLYDQLVDLRGKPNDRYFPAYRE